MNDIVKLPKLLAARLEKVSLEEGIPADALARQAIVERLHYLEWKRRAVAEGDADITAGRLLSTEQVFEAVAKQRVKRARKTHKTA